jgi:hypothetical protein
MRTQGGGPAHDPFPAVVVDRHWELVASNVTVSGLAIETFYPADETTAAILRGLAA